MFLGLCGIAKAGKSTIADVLVQKHGFVAVALADPMKRFCQEILEFSDEQCWGESDARNVPDVRYPVYTYEAPEGGNAHSFTGYLTPRYALQELGTTWGRACYEDAWVNRALHIARRLMSDQDWRYSPKEGLVFSEAVYTRNSRCLGVVIPDVRYLNEVVAIKKAGGKVVKIYREGAGLEGTAGKHSSETEQENIPPEMFDKHFMNTGNNPAELGYRVRDLLLALREGVSNVDF